MTLNYDVSTDVVWGFKEIIDNAGGLEDPTGDRAVMRIRDLVNDEVHEFLESCLEQSGGAFEIEVLP